MGLLRELGAWLRSQHIPSAQRYPNSLLRNREAQLERMSLNHHVLPQAPQNISYTAPLQSGACSIAGHYEVSAFGPCLKGVCGRGKVAVACDVDEVGDEGVGVVDYVAKSGLVESG